MKQKEEQWTDRRFALQMLTNRVLLLLAVPFLSKLSREIRDKKKEAKEGDDEGDVDDAASSLPFSHPPPPPTPTPLNPFSLPGQKKRRRRRKGMKAKKERQIKSDG